jgi:hypothetical protein
VVVDGTFKTTEAKLVLTTILGHHEGIAIPCAYLLGNSNDTDTYKKFYKVRVVSFRGKDAKSVTFI